MLSLLLNIYWFLLLMELLLYITVNRFLFILVSYRGCLQTKDRQIKEQAVK